MDGGVSPAMLRGAGALSSSSLLFASLELSDTRVYEPEIRALLGIASIFLRSGAGATTHYSIDY